MRTHLGLSVEDPVGATDNMHHVVILEVHDVLRVLNHGARVAGHKALLKREKDPP